MDGQFFLLQLREVDLNGFKSQSNSNGCIEFHSSRDWDWSLNPFFEKFSFCFLMTVFFYIYQEIDRLIIIYSVYAIRKEKGVFIHSLKNLQDWELPLIETNQWHYDFAWLQNCSIFACILFIQFFFITLQETHNF